MYSQEKLEAGEKTEAATSSGAGLGEGNSICAKKA
jgi:hypothetical protein